MARRKTRRKRKPRRKRRRKAHIPRLLGKSIVTRMRFVKGFSLDPGAGAIVSRTFSANGLTISDLSGADGQPTGFDQFNAFFDNYKVLSSTCKMTFIPIATANVIPGVYGVFQDDDVTLVYSSFQTLLMGNQSTTKNVRLAGIHGTTAMKPTSASYSAKRQLRLGGAQEVSLRGDAAANPALVQSYQCWYGSPDVANNPGSAHFLVQLDYVVLWTNAQFLTGSVAPA